MKVRCIRSMTDTFIEGDCYFANRPGVMPLHVEVFINPERKLFGQLLPDLKHILVYGKDIYKFQIIQE